MKFLTQAQFTEMWKLQDVLNTATSGPDWREKGQDWNLAIKAEIMEFFDYIGWKWWKEPEKVKSPKDMQARLELVDIYHFLLSDIIEKAAGIFGSETVYRELNHHLHLQGNSGPSVQVIKELDTYKVSNFNKVFYLGITLSACDWSWDELYKAYIGKVALNNFRQANGYKEGTYKKFWTMSPHKEPQEDNAWLEQVIAKLESEQADLTYELVYESLALIYERVKENSEL